MGFLGEGAWGSVSRPFLKHFLPRLGQFGIFGQTIEIIKIYFLRAGRKFLEIENFIMIQFRQKSCKKWRRIPSPMKIIIRAFKLINTAVWRSCYFCLKIVYPLVVSKSNTLYESTCTCTSLKTKNLGRSEITKFEQKRD